MPNTTITAIYQTQDGARVMTGFNTIRDAEEWRSLTDHVSPGFIREWSIDMTPYTSTETFTASRDAAVERAFPCSACKNAGNCSVCRTL